MGLLLAVAAPATATLTGDPDLLRLVGIAHGENTGKILSWRGTAWIQDIIEDKDGISQAQKGSASFVYDRVKDAKRWAWTIEDDRHRKGQELVPSLEQPISKSGMRKPNGFYRLFPAIKKDDQVENGLVIWPIEDQKIGGFSDDFDPMWYFTQAGHDIPEKLVFACEEAARSRSVSSTVGREGDIVVWEVGEKRDAPPFDRFEFDLSKGGNLVLHRARRATYDSVTEWTFEERDGIWVPKVFSNDRTETAPFRRTRRRVEFIEYRLNEPVNPLEFSLETLGVTPGTTVWDHILGTEYRYGGEESLAPLSDELLVVAGPMPDESIAVPGEHPRTERSDMPGRDPEVEASEPQQPSRGFGRYVLLAAGAVVIVAAGCFWFVRSRKRRLTQQAK